MQLIPEEVMGRRLGIEREMKAAKPEKKNRQGAERGNLAAVLTALVLVAIICGLSITSITARRTRTIKGE